MARKFGEGSQGPGVDARKILDTPAWEQLVLWVQDGALVAIGTTRDRGALSLTVTVDGQWERTYVRDGEQLELWVDELQPVVKAALEEARSSASAVQRRRGMRGV